MIELLRGLPPLLASHLELSLLALALAMAISLPLAIAVAARPRIASPAIANMSRVMSACLMASMAGPPGAPGAPDRMATAVRRMAPVPARRREERSTRMIDPGNGEEGWSMRQTLR